MEKALFIETFYFNHIINGNICKKAIRYSGDECTPVEIATETLLLEYDNFNGNGDREKWLLSRIKFRLMDYVKQVNRVKTNLETCELSPELVETLTTTDNLIESIGENEFIAGYFNRCNERQSKLIRHLMSGGTCQSFANSENVSKQMVNKIRKQCQGIYLDYIETV